MPAKKEREKKRKKKKKKDCYSFSQRRKRKAAELREEGGREKEKNWLNSITKGEEGWEDPPIGQERGGGGSEASPFKKSPKFKKRKRGRNAVTIRRKGGL